MGEGEGEGEGEGWRGREGERENIAIQKTNRFFIVPVNRISDDNILSYEYDLGMGPMFSNFQ